MMTKPVLFLDIDGVINVIPPSKGDPNRHPHLRVWKEWKKVDILGFPITYSPNLIAHLNRLSKKVEIVWLTTWRDQAVSDFAPVVGLDSFRYIDPKGSEYPWGTKDTLAAGPEMRWWKLNGVLEALHAESRPFIWIDDDLRSNTKKYVRSLAKDMDVPNLMFITFEALGIEPDHIERIDEFVSLHK
jgi:hypothetical protein